MKKGKHVVSFYRFTQLSNLEAIQRKLDDEFRRAEIVGTLLLAEEGFNASLAHASSECLDRAVRAIESLTNTDNLCINRSTANSTNPVFHRLKVRIRREIVNFGDAFDVSRPRGRHVKPKEWNKLMAQPDMVVLDVRNRYESEVGTFLGARAVDTDNFRDFRAFVKRELAEEKDKPIAMYCTGGIRCEKASQWMIDQGFENVYQLEGGILGYLATENPLESRWEGECFVFDQRVTVDHELHQGKYEQCFACRHPLSDEDRRSPLYEPAISCPHCAHRTSLEQKQRYGERGKQVALANMRGEQHVGARPNLNLRKKSFG